MGTSKSSHRSLVNPRRGPEESRFWRDQHLVAVLLTVVLVGACSAGQEDSTTTTDQGASTTSGATETTSAATTTPEEPSEVIIALDSDLTTLDAGLQAGRQDSLTLINVYDSLFTRADDGATLPWLVKDWSVTEDGLTYTFQLEEGVMFHNGTEMTAEDVAYTINRYAEPEFPGQLGINFTDVAAASVADTYTVEVQMDQPNPMFVRNIAHTQSPVIPKAVAESIAVEEFGLDPSTAIGTGAYRIVEWRKDDRLILDAFPDYWRGTPEIDHIEMVVIPDAASRTAALRAEEVDIVLAMDPEQVSSLEGTNAEARVSFGTDRVRLSLNAQVEPFSSLQVRQAINHAIDKQAIIDLVGVTAEPIIGTALVREIGYNPDLEDLYPFDPERARELLAEAGYPDGFEIDFHVRLAFPKVEEASQAIAQMLSDVGIRTNLIMLPSSDYQELMTTKSVILGYTANAGGATFHAQGAMTFIFDCREGRGAASHTGYYCNPDIYDLLDEGMRLLSEGDDAGSIAAYQEIDRILMEDAAQVLLYGNGQLWGVDKNLDWTPPPTHAMYMFDASWGGS